MNFEQIIGDIQAEIKNITEDDTLPMDRQVHRHLMNLLQSIDHDLEQVKKEV